MKSDSGFSMSSVGVDAISRRIRQTVDRQWRIMEVCGGQTRSMIRYNIEALLPPGIELVHGPGCPVCVTPPHVMDTAVSLAENSGVTLLTFGDMMKVPDSSGKPLSGYRGRGSSIKIIYSPLDALDFAAADRGRDFVMLAVGFETTAPLYAFAIEEAQRRDIKNLSFLTSLFTVPAAIEAIVSDPATCIDGILAAGHVCAITGEEEYRALSEKTSRPIVITGFEPYDIMLGIYLCTEMLQCGKPAVRNAYGRVVAKSGNIAARQAMYKVFEPCDAVWQGIGEIAGSGLKLRKEFEQFDAARRFPLKTTAMRNETGLYCPAGEIMQGKIQPSGCKYFGSECTPEAPLGAAMATAEGVCSILYNYSTARAGKRTVARQG